MTHRSLERAATAMLLGLALLLPATAMATPKMALTAGTPCSACHINGSGGGGRTEIGWGSMALVGATQYENLGLESLSYQETNLIGEEGYVSIGADVRLQVAKFGAPTDVLQDDGTFETVSPQRRVIPMQIQPYLGVYPTDWLTLYGTYAVGPATFQGKLCDPTYAGQSCFAALAKAKIKPVRGLSVKAGHFRPHIGNRHDDHTIMLNSSALTPRNSAIPPNYADPGAEVHYGPVPWLTIDAGGFLARNLAESIGNPKLVKENAPAGLARVAFQPRLTDDITSWLGASVFMSGDYRLENYFLGLGLLEWGALMVEAGHGVRGADVDQSDLNLMAMLSVTPLEWLTVNGRVEQATTTDTNGNQVAQTKAAVVGLEFFPLPYIEIRPEYRVLLTDGYGLGQYTVQLHLFY